MYRFISAVLILLVFSVSLHAQDSTGYLRIIELAEQDGDEGVIFYGTIINDHPKLHARNPTAVISLKKDGILITMLLGRCRDKPGPGETCTFEAETEYSREDYDAISARVAKGSLFREKPDPEILTGDLVLIEESLNVRSDGEGNTVILGELHNQTNAIVSNLIVIFDLYDSKGNFLGYTKEVAAMSSFGIYMQDVYPNETIPFALHQPDVPFAKVDSWECYIEFEVVEYYQEAIATSATSASWGTNQGREVALCFGLAG